MHLDCVFAEGKRLCWLSLAMLDLKLIHAHSRPEPKRRLAHTGWAARSGSPLQAAAQGQPQSAELKLRWWGGLCVLRAGVGRRERGWRALCHTMGRVGPAELSDG